MWQLRGKSLFQVYWQHLISLIIALLTAIHFAYTESFWNNSCSSCLGTREMWKRDGVFCVFLIVVNSLGAVRPGACFPWQKLPGLTSAPLPIPHSLLPPAPHPRPQTFLNYRSSTGTESKHTTDEPSGYLAIWGTQQKVSPALVWWVWPTSTPGPIGSGAKLREEGAWGKYSSPGIWTSLRRLPDLFKNRIADPWA